MLCFCSFYCIMGSWSDSHVTCSNFSVFTIRGWRFVLSPLSANITSPYHIAPAAPGRRCYGQRWWAPGIFTCFSLTKLCHQQNLEQLFSAFCTSHHWIAGQLNVLCMDLGTPIGIFLAWFALQCILLAWFFVQLDTPSVALPPASSLSSWLAGQHGHAEKGRWLDLDFTCQSQEALCPKKDGPTPWKKAVNPYQHLWDLFQWSHLPIFIYVSLDLNCHLTGPPNASEFDKKHHMESQPFSSHIQGRPYLQT